MFRNAKTKLPKEIQQKVDEWKFSSGAQVFCLVFYSDGKDVWAFQYVCLYQQMICISLYYYQC